MRERRHSMSKYDDIANAIIKEGEEKNRIAKMLNEIFPKAVRSWEEEGVELADALKKYDVPFDSNRSWSIPPGFRLSYRGVWIETDGQQFTLKLAIDFDNIIDLMDKGKKDFINSKCVRTNAKGIYFFPKSRLLATAEDDTDDNPEILSKVFAKDFIKKLRKMEEAARNN